MCGAIGLDWMAITDHDTFAGSDALAASGSLPVPLIRGVELSLRNMEGLHLLAYGTAEGEPLRSAVRSLAEQRKGRAAAMVERLKAIGFELDMDEIREQTRDAVGRPHIARAMVRKGYAASLEDAFARYLNPGRPGYVAAMRMNMEEALRAVLASGFVPVLAHPCELELPMEQLRALLTRWQAMGLMGVEVYHPSARRIGCEALERLVRPMGFLVTGGSDFHQEHDKHGSIGCMIPQWSRSAEDISALLQAMRNQKEKHDLESRT